MKKLTHADPEIKSPDLVAENIEQLQALFPEAITEGKVDFEVLKQLLGGAVEEREEKYGLNWNGKRRARQLALTPSTGTLRPCPEESVDWDTTQNLMIEGDNLEVLKLLQKSYAGKVKLIYIDPPYNTGKDFVYPDNFRDNIRNYLELTGQVDGEGRKLSSNTEASGRFHTDWLNMMYPRLKLARNLLQEDGVLFISIDDGEVSHLRSICDEVFGPENFIALFVWEKRTTRENRRVFSFNHEYVMCVAKNKPEFEQTRNLLPTTDEVRERYSNPDNDPRGPWQSVSLNAQAGHATKEQFYSLTTPGGRVLQPPSGRCWAVTKPKLEELIAANRVWFGETGHNVPRRKLFLSEAKDGLTPHTLWTASEVGTNDTAKKELIELFDGIEVFDTPKPLGLIERMIELTTDKSDLVLDFFAGAGPAGEAVFRKNRADSSNRRYILVQLPEPLDPDNKDQKTAADFCDKLGKPRTIAELTKERLRRAGKKIREKYPLFAGDLGFRVFKLASSNIHAWEPDRDNLPKTLQESIEHLKADRTEADILFEVLLKLGLDLTVPIEEKAISGKTVHGIGAGTLLVCLAEHIATAEVEPLALGIVGWRKAMAPAGESTVVFRDSAFADDVAKTNLTAILQQHGLENVRSL
ncbi:MAG: site-specific DNA-methyltransferase [Candidatus Tectomicrobia bacterium]|nr:site-specific DNA-methyltransferase [Candidatus Tectomicrobia bacterium]